MRALDELAKNPKSKDDALEAVDFIINVLKEHEKDLDRLINNLAKVTGKMGTIGELSSKVDRVEEKISILQKEVTNLICYLSGPPKEVVPATVVKEQPRARARIIRSPPSA